MKKRIVFRALLAVVAVLYVARVLYLNRDLEKSRITYVSDREGVEYDGMTVKLTDQKLYEMPAFVEAYPAMQEFYHISTNVYAKAGDIEGFKSLKYVLAAKLSFQNHSDEERQVAPVNFFMVNANQTIFQGVDAFASEAINGGAVFKLAPGETREILLHYDLYGKTIYQLSAKRMLAEELAVIVSGYPHIQGIRMDHLSLVESKGTFDPYSVEEEPAVRKVEKEDTLSGTILPVGGECVTGGVGVTVESVDIVRNVKEFPGYQENAWKGFFRRRYLKKDGSVGTIWEDDHGLPKSYYKKGYKNYIIFVTIRFHNYTNQTANVYNAYDLMDGKASWDCPRESDYTSCLLEKDERDAAQGIVRAGQDQVLVLGYARSIRNDVDIYKTPLYISNDAEVSENFDLDKGKCGFGKYIRIQ